MTTGPISFKSINEQACTKVCTRGTMKRNIAIIMALPVESHNLFENENIHIYYSGIGKVNATIKTMEIIQTQKYNHILNLGSAGSSKFNTHSLVEINQFIQKDMDITPLGYKIGETPMDEISYHLPVHHFLTDLPKGSCGTADGFDIGQFKIQTDVADMEAYAIAKTCIKFNVGFTSIKYITDGEDHNAHNDWQANLITGAHKLLEIYKKIRSNF